LASGEEKQFFCVQQWLGRIECVLAYRKDLAGVIAVLDLLAEEVKMA